MENIKLLIILLLLALASAVQADSQVDYQGRILHPKGLLWKIEKAGMSPSHLYGTMHVGDPRVVKLAPEVEKAFVEADRFGMEVLLNFQAMGVITSGSFFNDGRTLKSVMQEADYQRLIELLEQQFQMPEQAVMHMRPWVVLIMLMMPEKGQADSSSALDMVLYRRAATRRMPLLGLETAEEQLAVFESMTMEEQIWMLNKSVEDYGMVEDLFPILLDNYLRRDLAGMVKLQDRYMYPESDIDDRFMHELLDKRNVRMVERMQDFLKQGNAFIAIGALHLPGKKGVLHLLEQQGYKVQSVY
ncbi:MAG: TraB/GumN family protein [Gammaproteobacteria bacterium]|nr:TraB/GumN family protein [Gammaproteobacteria bacterium]